MRITRMSLVIFLEKALRLEEEDFRFVILALLALCLRGLREHSLFLLRPPPPRNFLIIFCVDYDTCFDRMSPVCEGLAAI